MSDLQAPTAAQPGSAARPATATPASATPAATTAPAADQPLTELGYHLYSNQFQQIGWLAIAAAGGALVMLQAGVFKIRPWTPVAAAVVLAIAALVAVLGSMELTRGATEGVDVRKSAKRYTMASFFLVGAGTGVLVMGLIRNAFP